MKKPYILVTPDSSSIASRRGDLKSYQIEQSYTDAVFNTGGLPFLAPYTSEQKSIEQFLEQADGLLLTGGNFDIDPKLFGEEVHPSLGTIKADRTDFESKLYYVALKKRMPILAICGGMQLISTLEGGTLWQDLRSQNPSPIEHEQLPSKSKAGHSVNITADSLFAEIVGKEDLGVNSTHHQAVKKLGSGFKATAFSGDGLLEAFEMPNYPFLQAVQWHPEALINCGRNQRIYKNFIEAAKLYSSKVF